MRFKRNEGNSSKECAPREIQEDQGACDVPDATGAPLHDKENLNAENGARPIRDAPCPASITYAQPSSWRASSSIPK